MERYQTLKKTLVENLPPVGCNEENYEKMTKKQVYKTNNNISLVGFVTNRKSRS